MGCAGYVSLSASLFPLFKKCAFCIGADVFTEWGVVPEYVVPLSVFPFGVKKERNNILWYNPPLSKNVSTKIVLLVQVDRHFPKHHNLEKS